MNHRGALVGGAHELLGFVLRSRDPDVITSRLRFEEHVVALGNTVVGLHDAAEVQLRRPDLGLVVGRFERLALAVRDGVDCLPVDGDDATSGLVPRRYVQQREEPGLLARGPRLLVHEDGVEVGGHGGSVGENEVQPRVGNVEQLEDAPVHPHSVLLVEPPSDTVHLDVANLVAEPELHAAGYMIPSHKSISRYK